MKTKLSLFYLWSFIFGLTLSSSPCALGQIPQGFNYQAVAMTGAGAPIANSTIQVKMGILSDTLTPVVVWEELHNPVKTNLNGIFSLVIGTGTKQDGSVSSFEDIDWSAGPLYLRTKIYYQNAWKEMGSARLWSVPYAMVSGDMGGPVKKLSVEGETSSAEEPLFEVKNKDGQTVFAVYNEGVRIYVSDGAKAVKGGFAVGGFGTDKAESAKYLFVGKDSVRIYLDTNPLTKGKKSGFAVGGYDITKGVVQNYLDVSADSVRIYIDSDPASKKVKGGFAVGGYDMTKGNVQDYLDVSGDSVRIYIDDKGTGGKGKKGGFAVGGFDMSKGGNAHFFNVEVDTTGRVVPAQNRILWYPMKNAFLTGKILVEDKDSVGINSFASGYESKAKGMYSQAMGYMPVARGDYSTAIGKNAAATEDNSFAFGSHAIASATGSFAFGDGVVARGRNSFAFGAIGRDESGLPTGVMTEANGPNSVAFGLGALATNLGSYAFGSSDTASGKWAVVMGGKSHASGDYSMAMGYGTRSSGRVSLAIGNGAKASGEFSAAIGGWAVAKGVYSIAMGNSVAGDYYSVAIGYLANAQKLNSLAFGNNTTAAGLYSMALGNNSVAYGNYSTALTTNSVARGLASVAIGHLSKARGNYSLSVGYFTDAKGYYSSATGMGTISQQLGSFVTGRYNSPKGDSLNYNTSYPLFIIGNGTEESSRSNAMEVYPDGHSVFYGNMIVRGTGSLVSHSPELILSEAGVGIPSSYWKEWTFKGTGKKLNLVETTSSSSNVRISIADGGNIGIGTESPGYKLDVVGRSRFQSGGGSAGLWFMNAANSAERAFFGMYDDNYAGIYGVSSTWGFVMNTNNGNVGIGTVNPAYNLQVAGTCRVGSTFLVDGSVGIGVTSSPTYAFHVVRSTGNYVGGFVNTGGASNANGITIYAGTETTGGAYFLRFQRPGTLGTVNPATIGSIRQNDGSSVVYNTTSDQRVKENIADTHFALADLLNVKVRDFEFRDDPENKVKTGFIAQELFAVYPEAVTKPVDDYDLWQVDYGRITPLLVKAIQDQQQQIKSAREENQLLRSELQSLKDKMNRIEEMLVK